MANKKIICLGIISIMLISMLSGCVQNTPSKEEEVTDKRLNIVYSQYIGSEQYKIIHDDINNVTCYVYEYYSPGSGGISCIIDTELYGYNYFK